MGKMSLARIARFLVLLFAALFLPAGLATSKAANVTSSSSDCRLLAGAAEQPVGTAPCPGVRPGAFIYLERGTCTLNFLFEASDGDRYIGTAGHCALRGGGERVFDRRRGPKVSDPSGNRIGTVAYAVLKDAHDFALIRLDDGVRAKAKMCYFGGPTGINDELGDDLVRIHYYGNGLGIGNVQLVNQPTVPARTAIANGMPDPDEVTATGAAFIGDSGSATVDEKGRAVGVLVAISAEGIHITRISPQVERAEKALGVSLRLQKATFSE